MTGAAPTTGEPALASGEATTATRDAALGLRRIIGNAMALLGAWVLPRLFTAAAIVVAAQNHTTLCVSITRPLPSSPATKP